MINFNKFFEKKLKLFTSIINDNYKLNHKYQNKNQTTNSDVVLQTLKNKQFNPKIIVDVGCGYGQWTKKMIKYYPDSEYFLFDAILIMRKN